MSACESFNYGNLNFSVVGTPNNSNNSTSFYANNNPVQPQSAGWYARERKEQWDTAEKIVNCDKQNVIVPAEVKSGKLDVKICCKLYSDSQRNSSILHFYLSNFYTKDMAIQLEA